MIFTPDTNLLVYIHDGRNLNKQRIATDIFRHLVDRENSRVALQVIGELYSVLTRKLQQDPATASAAARSLSVALDPFNYETTDVHVALSLAANGVMSYWDGLLVSAASRAGCDLLISEAMQDGFHFDGLQIITPFAGDALNPRLDTLLDKLKGSE